MVFTKLASEKLVINLVPVVLAKPKRKLATNAKFRLREDVFFKSRKFWITCTLFFHKFEPYKFQPLLAVTTFHRKSNKLTAPSTLSQDQ